MHYNFGTPGLVIISVFLLLCLIFFFYSRKKIRSRIKEDLDLANKKYGILWIIIGLVVSIISVIFHLYFQIDISRSNRLLQPLLEMTSEPIIIFTIIFFLIGVTILFIGIYSVRVRKEMLDKSTQ
ncbi:hypothetical protein Calab_2174 [Caldithrix abyssi DSM 13497]|uniref:Uncharacterized protein n=1 Tax=Caldithrix abyssi DSM 13497 TaxID=880073 RepID=H1XW12_CALAY|nr:hypothetical protein [Caldithrix abyssi]EHO41784.1 hypothetical protein Calab_2174 [Caldithrix abyssi DSM 13497]